MSRPSTRSLNIFFLSMINVAAICSIRNWPLTAEYGFSSLFYFIIAAVGFFIPVSLVSAELASGWPERGGIYVWVKEAFGHRMGFLSVWLPWISNVVWYPAILSFVAGTIAFIINPDLVNNTLYMFCVIFGTFWGATLVNLLGMKTSGWISSLGVIIGTFIPGLLIIILGLIWMAEGRPTHIAFTFDSFVPDLTSPSKLALLAGVLLGLAGMEMSAIHAREVKNPQKNFPRAILLSTVIILALSIIGSLAIAIVIPQKEISLVAGGIEAIFHFLNAYNLESFVPLFAFFITLGALGSICTWAAGPSKGLLAAAQEGDLPPVLHKINKKNMPVGMFFFQGIIVSILTAVFLFLPTVSSSFWFLTVLAAQLYILMYILMFVVAIVLRYKRPDVKRAYKIPFGNLGMWITAGIGILGCSFTFVVGFFPPEQLEMANIAYFELLLILGCVLFCAAPFIILLFKKPNWNEHISFQDED